MLSWRVPACTMALKDTSASSPSNQIQTCYKGHRHLSTPWTIYVIDPAVSFETDKYNDAMFPLESFDTEDEVKGLYKLPPFSEPNGPPSWSMVVPGGAIAVFRGGKYGFPAVQPKWEDPAAQNGGEYRFVFAREQNPLQLVDDAFAALINWMVTNSAYEGTQILGLFVKNATWLNNATANPLRHEVQFRIWTSEMPAGSMPRLARIVGEGIAEVLDRSGAKGILTYKRLQNLMQKAGLDLENRDDKGGLVVKFFIPLVRKDTTALLPTPSDDSRVSGNSSGFESGRSDHRDTSGTYPREQRQFSGGSDGDNSSRSATGFKGEKDFREQGRVKNGERFTGMSEKVRAGDSRHNGNSDSSGDAEVPKGRFGQRSRFDAVERS